MMFQAIHNFELSLKKTFIGCRRIRTYKTVSGRIQQYKPR